MDLYELTHESNNRINEQIVEWAESQNWEKVSHRLREAAYEPHDQRLVRLKASFLAAASMKEQFGMRFEPELAKPDVLRYSKTSNFPDIFVRTCSLKMKTAVKHMRWPFPDTLDAGDMVMFVYVPNWQSNAGYVVATGKFSEFKLEEKEEVRWFNAPPILRHEKNYQSIRFP